MLLRVVNVVDYAKKGGFKSAMVNINQPLELVVRGLNFFLEGL